MSTFLFDKIIFGPVWSRRLGESLGVNLLPAGRKICNFNCVYCECGLTPHDYKQAGFPSAAEVKKNLEQKLAAMKANGNYLDAITFAGNGEPTLHPEFSQIVKDSLEIRDYYFPSVKIAVLSNATQITNENIREALLKTDLNILKLDSGIENTVRLINCPGDAFKLDDVVNAMKSFHGKLIIQTLFFNGTIHGVSVNNTSDTELEAWRALIEDLRPTCVMIYSLARDTAVDGLSRISEEKLKSIGELLNKTGIETIVTP